MKVDIKIDLRGEDGALRWSKKETPETMLLSSVWNHDGIVCLTIDGGVHYVAIKDLSEAIRRLS